MSNTRLSAVVLASCLAIAAQSPVDAQGRAGRGGRGGGDADPGVPTAQQWADSAEAQRRVAVIVPVTRRGTPHTVIVLAATQMPTAASLVQFERVFTEFAKPRKVEAVLNMHANGVQDDFAFLEMIRTNPEGPVPYLYGPERFGRWMDIMIECGRARLAALGAS